MVSRTLRIGFSVILAVALLVAFLWNVNLAEVWAAVQGAHGGWLLASTAMALFSYWLRALRWQLILRPVGRTRHSSVTLATASGYAAMALLPARLGDLVRPLLLARRERLPVSGPLATIVTERVLDLWTVLLFFVVFTLWPPPMAGLGERTDASLRMLTLSGYLAAAGVVLGTAILIALLRFKERFINAATAPVAKLRPKWKEPLANFLGHFLEGLRVLGRPRELIVTATTSIVLWYLIYWQVNATLIAFSLHFPLRVSFLLVTLAVIGLAIPTPAGVGGFHKAFQVGLTMFFAVDVNVASGMAIVHHAICFIPITVIGLLCLPLFGVSLREAETLSKSEQEASQPV
jgi:uncharacterized protein (TIRG00374 family)